MHNGPGSNRSLMPTRTALIGVSIADRVKLYAATLRAYKSVGEAKPEQFLFTGIIGSIAITKFLKADFISACHIGIPLDVLGIVSHIICPKKRTLSRYCGLLS